MTLPPLFLGAPTGTHPPAAQAARRDADVGPLSLPELPEDIRDTIMNSATNFSEEFEGAPNLPEDRVGVPYPQGHALRGKHKEDFAIPQIGMCGIHPDWCREYLVTALLTKEKAYWEHPSRGQNFDNVLDAINRRDGVRVVTLPADDKLNLKERVALQRIDGAGPLPWSNATAIVLRARHWFRAYAEQHADGANFFGKRSPDGKFVSANNVPLPYGVNSGLRAATRIVALAQALVRLRDAGREDLAHFLQATVEYPICNPGAFEPRTNFWNVTINYYYQTPSPNGPSTVDQCIHEAKRVILEYGPPDAWNTSGVDTLAGTFEAHVLVDTNEEDAALSYRIMNRWRGRGFSNPAPSPSVEEYKRSVDAIVGVLGTRSIQLRWPVGLYDTSNATNLTHCFAGCDTFNGYLHGWNTANVATMHGCFSGCKTFNRPLQSWNVGKCESFTLAFNECAAFNQPLGDWVVKKAPAVFMRAMFAGCAAFAQPLHNWYDQLKNRVAISKMFAGAFAISEMFAGATAWLARARLQQADGSQFFSRLAPHVNLVTGTLSEF